MKYPDLKDSKIICFDVETYDPDLTTRGPGVFRRDGNIIGMGIANEKGFAEYYNIGHPDCTSELKIKNKKYLKDVLNLPCKKIGTSILYDLDWTENWWEIPVNGELHDIQIAEALIDENRKLLGISNPYSLDSLAKKYLNKHKYKTEIDLFCEKNNLKGDSRKWLWMMDHSLVYKYGIEDVLLPLEIFKLQWIEMTKQDLLPLYHMEMGLHRLLLKMRKTGVKLNEKKVNDGMQYLNNIIKEEKNKLLSSCGKFNYNSSQQIGKVLDKLKIDYPKTDKGNPQLGRRTLATMHNLNSDIVDGILRLRNTHKTLHTFFINSFNNHRIQGRIHCSFFPLSTDNYGTKSGRFSSANPNLQQIPSEGEYKKLCRDVFIPEEDCDWIKLDYSQIEYRIISHYAIGPRSEEVRDRYRNDPDVDYHKLVMEWTGLNRKRAKYVNFGASYSMGVKTCAGLFGWPLEEAKRILDLHQKEVPFIKITSKHVVNTAKGRGYIKTILGRRARVTEQMRNTGTEYSMFNRLIQGSAADVLKKGMLDAFKKGLFDILPLHLTVHDELDISKPRTKEADEALLELKHTMENPVKLTVPLRCDMEIGPSWGDLKDYVGN